MQGRPDSLSGHWQQMGAVIHGKLDDVVPLVSPRVGNIPTTVWRHPVIWGPQRLAILRWERRVPSKGDAGQHGRGCAVSMYMCNRMDGKGYESSDHERP